VPRLRDLLAELDPQSAFRVSRLDGLFQAAADGAKPPPLAGELRWSYRYAWTLQGVHGTRAPLKRRYSAAELALARVAEPLAALARRAGGRDRRPVLELAWRALVRCQFHDAIAGCAGDDVARAVESRLTSVEALAHEVGRGSLQARVHPHPHTAPRVPGAERAGAGVGQRRPRGGCDRGGRCSTSGRRRARQGALAQQPLDRGRARAHRSAHAARPAQRTAVCESAPYRRRRRRRRYV